MLASLPEIAARSKKADGIALGEALADQVLQARMNDSLNAREPDRP
jgi:hypothetical protein